MGQSVSAKFLTANFSNKFAGDSPDEPAPRVPWASDTSGDYDAWQMYDARVEIIDPITGRGSQPPRFGSTAGDEEAPSGFPYIISAAAPIRASTLSHAAGVATASAVVSHAPRSFLPSVASPAVPLEDPCVLIATLSEGAKQPTMPPKDHPILFHITGRCVSVFSVNKAHASFAAATSATSATVAAVKKRLAASKLTNARSEPGKPPVGLLAPGYHATDVPALAARSLLPLWLTSNVRPSPTAVGGATSTTSGASTEDSTVSTATVVAVTTSCLPHVVALRLHAPHIVESVPLGLFCPIDTSSAAGSAPGDPTPADESMSLIVFKGLYQPLLRATWKDIRDGHRVVAKQVAGTASVSLTLAPWTTQDFTAVSVTASAGPPKRPIGDTMCTSEVLLGLRDLICSLETMWQHGRIAFRNANWDAVWIRVDGSLLAARCPWMFADTRFATPILSNPDLWNAASTSTKVTTFGEHVLALSANSASAVGPAPGAFFPMSPAAIVRDSIALRDSKELAYVAPEDRDPSNSDAAIFAAQYSHWSSLTRAEVVERRRVVAGPSACSSAEGAIAASDVFSFGVMLESALFPSGSPLGATTTAAATAPQLPPAAQMGSKGWGTVWSAKAVSDELLKFAKACQNRDPACRPSATTPAGTGPYPFLAAWDALAAVQGCALVRVMATLDALRHAAVARHCTTGVTLDAVARDYCELSLLPRWSEIDELLDEVTGRLRTRHNPGDAAVTCFASTLRTYVQRCDVYLHMHLDLYKLPYDVLVRRVAPLLFTETLFNDPAASVLVDQLLCPCTDPVGEDALASNPPESIGRFVSYWHQPPAMGEVAADAAKGGGRLAPQLCVPTARLLGVLQETEYIGAVTVLLEQVLRGGNRFEVARSTSTFALIGIFRNVHRFMTVLDFDTTIRNVLVPGVIGGLQHFTPDVALAALRAFDTLLQTVVRALQHARDQVQPVYRDLIEGLSTNVFALSLRDGCHYLRAHALAFIRRIATSNVMLAPVDAEELQDNVRSLLCNSLGMLKLPCREGALQAEPPPASDVVPVLLRHLQQAAVTWGREALRQDVATNTSPKRSAKHRKDVVELRRTSRSVFIASLLVCLIDGAQVVARHDGDDAEAEALVVYALKCIRSGLSELEVFLEDAHLVVVATSRPPPPGGVPALATAAAASSPAIAATPLHWEPLSVSIVPEAQTSVPPTSAEAVSHAHHHEATGDGPSAEPPDVPPSQHVAVPRPPTAWALTMQSVMSTSHARSADSAPHSAPQSATLVIPAAVHLVDHCVVTPVELARLVVPCLTAAAHVLAVAEAADPKPGAIHSPQKTMRQRLLAATRVVQAAALAMVKRFPQTANLRGSLPIVLSSSSATAPAETDEPLVWKTPSPVGGSSSPASGSARRRRPSSVAQAGGDKPPDDDANPSTGQPSMDSNSYPSSSAPQPTSSTASAAITVNICLQVIAGEEAFRAPTNPGDASVPPAQPPLATRLSPAASGNTVVTSRGLPLDAIWAPDLGAAAGTINLYAYTYDVATLRSAVIKLMTAERASCSEATTWAAVREFAVSSCPTLVLADAADAASGSTSILSRLPPALWFLGAHGELCMSTAKPWLGSDAALDSPPAGHFNWTAALFSGLDQIAHGAPSEVNLTTTTHCQPYAFQLDVDAATAASKSLLVVAAPSLDAEGHLVAPVLPHPDIPCVIAESPGWFLAHEDQAAPPASETKTIFNSTVAIVVPFRALVAFDAAETAASVHLMSKVSATRGAAGQQMRSWLQKKVAASAFLPPKPSTATGVGRSQLADQPAAVVLAAVHFFHFHRRRHQPTNNESSSVSLWPALAALEARKFLSSATTSSSKAQDVCRRLLEGFAASSTDVSRSAAPPPSHVALHLSGTNRCGTSVFEIQSVAAEGATSTPASLLRCHMDGEWNAAQILHIGAIISTKGNAAAALSTAAPSMLRKTGPPPSTKPHIHSSWFWNPATVPGGMTAPSPGSASSSSVFASSAAPVAGPPASDGNLFSGLSVATTGRSPGVSNRLRSDSSANVASPPTARVVKDVSAVDGAPPIATDVGADVVSAPSETATVRAAAHHAAGGAGIGQRPPRRTAAVFAAEFLDEGDPAPPRGSGTGSRVATTTTSTVVLPSRAVIPPSAQDAPSSRNAPVVLPQGSRDAHQTVPAVESHVEAPVSGLMDPPAATSPAVKASSGPAPPRRRTTVSASAAPPITDTRSRRSSLPPAVAAMDDDL